MEFANISAYYVIITNLFQYQDAEHSDFPLNLQTLHLASLCTDAQ